MKYNKDRLPHANLLIGGTADDAMRLAAVYNCLSEGERPCGTCVSCRKLEESNHPDVITFDCAQAKLEQIRDLVYDTRILPHEGRHKVYILFDADNLSNMCQNALLKSLEEAPARVVFILTAQKPSQLLPTVRSRLTTGHFVSEKRPVSDGGAAEILEAYDKRDELNILMSSMSLEKATRDVLSEFINGLRTGMLERGALEAAERLGELQLTLDRNAGVGHVCGAIAAILAENMGELIRPDTEVLN